MTTCLTKKLDHKWLGPFEIEKVISSATVKLHLSPHKCGIHLRSSISKALPCTLTHCVSDSACYATPHCPLHLHLCLFVCLFVCLFTFVTGACVVCLFVCFPFQIVSVN